GKNDQFVYHTSTMSALGMCARVNTQRDLKGPFLELAAKRVASDRPAVSKDRLSVDYYYWHCGTIALNQFDGPASSRRDAKYWGAWQRAVTEALLALQEKSEHGCASGGWITPDRWAYAGGPLYTTAINVMTLEDIVGKR